MHVLLGQLLLKHGDHAHFILSFLALCVSQAWLLGLLAAQRDDRLALLHLGHVHHRGLHGFPIDTDLAYAYYANIAKQTTIDRQNPTPQQVMDEFAAGCFCMRVFFGMKSNTFTQGPSFDFYITQSSVLYFCI